MQNHWDFCFTLLRICLNNHKPEFEKRDINGENMNGKKYRLRNHIPISGPATREPIVGDEAELRVSLGFTPKWYVDRLVLIL